MEFSAIITGASKGIGYASTRFLLEQHDFEYHLFSRTTDYIVELTESFPNRTLHAHSLELSSFKESKFSLTLQKPLKLLFLNAGVFLPDRILTGNSKNLETQLQVNTIGTVRFLRSISHLLIDDVTRIVLTSSVGALHGLEDAGSYAVSKHALLGVARSLRLELKERRIPVTALHLGATWSDSWKDSGVDASLLIDPTDVGRTLDWIIQLSPRSSVEDVLITPLRM